MSFSTAISGLTAAANMLSVTGNNVANANTTGFKESRSEFEDLYANNFANVTATTPGSGVRIVNDAQLFHQGTLDYTNNTLDLGVNGDGFFVLGQSINNTNAQVYSRNGTFHANQDGLVINNDNQPLMVYAPNGNDISAGFSTKLQTLQVNTVSGSPQATSTISQAFNLNSSSTPPTTTTFSPTDSTSYNWSNSVTIYDSLGNSHALTSYFVKTSTAGSWSMYSAIDGTQLTTPAQPVAVSFDQNGKLSAPAAPLAISYTIPSSNAAALNISMDMAGSTQLAANSYVSNVSQNGLPPGNLTGISIDKAGIVSANYSNGATKPLGQVALARFQNNQGLQKIGDTEWAQTVNSGSAIIGAAGNSGFGAINSGALEQSNVDIAQQLIKLIVAQQSYQANAQSITTENQAIQSILNIR